MIDKLKNSLFFKSTFILLIGGILGKIVGFFIKIIITRTFNTETIGLYSLLSPSISIITTISIFSYPTIISSLSSKKYYDNKTLIFSALISSLIINIIIIIILLILSKYICNNLLKEDMLYYPFVVSLFTIPFISFSSIIKGYFWGKQNMKPYMLSNFLEQVTRIIFISLFIEKIYLYKPTYAICFIFIVNIIGEIVSQIVMILFIPKYKRVLKDFSINFKYIINIYKLCIPATISKLIGSFAYFLEPIILTNELLYMGYSRNYITYEYGIINAYSLTLLLLPAFFTQNMSTSLVPEISKNYALHNYKLCIKRIKQIVITSFLIGSISTLIILINPKFFLKLLFNTTNGYEYIKLLAPFTFLFYIESPLISSLNAINKPKHILFSIITCSFLRLITIIIFIHLNFGIYSLIISIIVNLISSIIIYYLLLKKEFTSL